MKPFFSVIIPIYKVEKYLADCVQSVLSQSFSNYECILVNDGSPDNSLMICDEYEKKYIQIRVIHKENGGLSDARNVGIHQARGEYIILLDGDDKFADNDLLNNLFNIIQKYKTDIVLNVNFFKFYEDGGRELFDKYDGDIKIASPQNIIHGLKNSLMLMTAWLFVIRKEHLIKNNLFFKRGLLHEDEHWMPRALFTTKQIALSHSLSYAYRVRGGSIMSTVTPKRLFDLLSIVDDLFEWSRDDKTYGKDGVGYMLDRAKDLCELVLHYRKDLKQQYKQEYRAIGEGLRKRIKKMPILYPPKQYVSIVFFGVDNTDALFKFCGKLRNIPKKIKTKCCIKNFIKK